MKLAKGIIFFGMALILVGATGCKKRIQDVTPLPGYEPAPSGRSSFPGDAFPLGGGPGGIGTGIGTGTEGMIPMTDVPRDDWERDRQTFAAQTVYFDFDQSNVRPSELPKLETVASRMGSMPYDALLIEGHCDERGTTEYNRSLGERRALSVREVLVTYGVAPDRIETVSFGEDRPVDPGHSRAAWDRNRRGEIILLKPPMSAGGR